MKPIIYWGYVANFYQVNKWLKYGSIPNTETLTAKSCIRIQVVDLARLQAMWHVMILGAGDERRGVWRTINIGEAKCICTDLHQRAVINHHT